MRGLTASRGTTVTEAALGYEPITTTPDEFAARIKADIPKWAKVIHDANIKLEQ
jgi:tripartite-type tricarboxylate transporter receptor subunit TctC